MACFRCNGSGKIGCTACGGQGRKPDPARGIATCTVCMGAGSFKCEACGGTGGNVNPKR